MFKMKLCVVFRFNIHSMNKLSLYIYTHISLMKTEKKSLFNYFFWKTVLLCDVRKGG